MAQTKALQLKDEILELEEKKKKLRVEVELLERRCNEKAEALTDLRASLFVAKPEYSEIEKEHRKEVEEYQEKVATLFERIENNQDIMKVLEVDLRRMRKDVGVARDDLDEIRMELIDKNIELEGVTGKLNDTKSVLSKEMLEKQEELAKLRVEISEVQGRLAYVIEDTDKRKEVVLKEEKLLAVRKKDLEIYEMRLRRKYPEEIYVLPEL